MHGDIKPANVLIVDGQTIKLSDFGLSYCLSATGEPSTAISGTPDYMPPEVTRGGRINHQGDMYSLGVTLFVITFGRLPYTSPVGSLEERLRQHRDSPVEFPNPWPAEIPLPWRGVLARLLNKNPEQRYRDFTELAVDLDQLAPRLLPTASPLLRGLAWLVDGLLVSSPLTIIAIMSSSNPFTGAALLGSVLSAGVCLGVCLLQGWWGTTPGKRLFQIRIADQHGLTPNRAVLAARASFQFMWAWSMALDELIRLLPLPNAAFVVSVLVVLFLHVEMAFVILAKGQSVHDRIFRTRVVLDAQGEHRR